MQKDPHFAALEQSLEFASTLTQQEQEFEAMGRELAQHQCELQAIKKSLSWRMTEYLIRNGRIGCVPGVDFGANGEGYVRFCFARDRSELSGALASMRTVLSRQSSVVSLATE